MSDVFVLTKTDTRHQNLTTVLNKKHAPRELLSFKNFIYKEKCGIHKMKECKRNAINKYFFSRKFKRWKI